MLGVYEDISTGKLPLTRKAARVLFMTLEHEAFHAEVSDACGNTRHILIPLVDIVVHAPTTSRHGNYSAIWVHAPDVEYTC